VVCSKCEGEHESLGCKLQGTIWKEPQYIFQVYNCIDNVAPIGRKISVTLNMLQIVKKRMCAITS